jgi:hypothetical protein
MEANVIAYKFLREDRTTVFSQFRWPDGEWVEAAVDPCRSGIHACRPSDLPYWVGRTLHEVELDGAIVEERTKVIAPRGRIVRRITAWEDGVREEYAAMCAERIHALADADRLRAWDDSEPSDGPAVLGFMAAVIAEQSGGVEAYRAERARQARWLAERLGL